MGCAHARPAAVQAPQQRRTGMLHVSLVKQDDNYLGLKLKQGQSGVQVASIIEGQGGLVEKWNMDNPSQAVRPSDWLIALNSVRVFYLSPIVEDLRRSGPLEMVFTEQPADQSVFGLQHRDFNETDYDALLALDMTIAPKCAARAANIIRQLPLVEVETTPEGKSSGHHCSICLEGFEKEEKVARLPCSHLFHRNCIAGWLQNGISTLATTAKCPNCAQSMEEGLLALHNSDTPGCSSSCNPGDTDVVHPAVDAGEETELEFEEEVEIYEEPRAPALAPGVAGNDFVQLERGLPLAGRHVVVSM